MLSISAQSFAFLSVQRSSFDQVGQHFLGEFDKMLHSSAPTANSSPVEHRAIKWSDESGEYLQWPAKRPASCPEPMGGITLILAPKRITRRSAPALPIRAPNLAPELGF